MQSVSEPVPFLDLSGEFREIEAEWMAALREIGQSGRFILGPNVTAFEQELADYVGATHGVGVANGTDALMLSLRALGIGPGDEVITSPFTFFASAEVIDMVGATPVFVDIDAGSFTIDPQSIRARITDRTRAILPVHLFGHPADMSEIMDIADEHGLAVVEDCAQAFGANDGGKRVGSMGTTGCFSFYPTKVLGCYGDGGMITTSSSELVEHLHRLRNHGAVQPFIHTEIGTNSRLDEVQAALLRIKLRRADGDILRRREVADLYTELLEDTDIITPSLPHRGGHVFNLYTIRTPARDRIREHLGERHIASSLCYPEPLHLQEVYRDLGYQRGDLPVCEAMSAEVLSLPVFPDMTDAQVEQVCNAVREAL